VEILPLSALMENPDWPDYLAVDLDRSAFGQLMERADLGSLSIRVEVLVQSPMPCRGIGVCGVCAVQTRRGVRFACTDGPVFPLKELRYVA
jgi:dihydroorotate dehydrogenase electron transfer subunit